MVSHRVEGLRACAFGAPVCYALHQGGKAQGGGTGDKADMQQAKKERPDQDKDLICIHNEQLTGIAGNLARGNCSIKAYSF